MARMLCCDKGFDVGFDEVRIRKSRPFDTPYALCLMPNA